MDENNNSPPEMQHKRKLAKRLSLKIKPELLALTRQDQITEAESVLNQGEEFPTKKGALWKRGGGKFSKKYKLRFFILAQDQDKNPKLYYYKQSGTSWNEKKPRGYIDLANEYSVVDNLDKNRGRCFQLVPADTTQRTWYLCADSEEEKRKWVSIIQQILDHTFNVEKQQAADLLSENLMLPWEKFEMEEIPFANGASGKIYKAIWDGVTEVAVKLLIGYEHLGKRDRDQFLHEIQVLSKLSHPNVVRMLGYIWKDSGVGLVTEFVRGGDLSKYIFDTPPLDEILKLSLCLSIARAMHYLHTMKLIHCDLKPQNILVEDLKQANIKICDFGLSILNKQTVTEENKIGGSMAYAAPELPSLQPTDKVDVYSFGVIMWEIYHQTRAWGGLQSWDITKKRDGGQRPPIRPDNPLRSVIEASWNHKPELRPAFKVLYGQLEEKKLSFLLQTHNETVSNLDQFAKLTALDKINRVFGKGTSVSWDSFLSVCYSIFNLRIEVFEYLRWVVAKDGMVEKARWEKLMKWFTPLIEEDGYSTRGASTVPQPKAGFTIEDVIDFVKPNWFFGFLDANDAKAILLSKLPGAFLFRFSGEEGKFTLSAVHNTQVVHWRITREVLGKGLAIYKLEDDTFKSLYEIIEEFKVRPLITDKNEGPLFLLEPCDRNVDLKDLPLLHKRMLVEPPPPPPDDTNLNTDDN